MKIGLSIRSEMKTQKSVQIIIIIIIIIRIITIGLLDFVLKT